MSGIVGRSSRQREAGELAADQVNPADLDSDMPATAEIAAAIRTIQAEMRRVHPSEVDYIAGLNADLDVLREELGQRIEELEGINYWQSKISEDGMAANIAAEIAQAKSDSDVWAIATSVSKHFREGLAEPEPEPVELDALVPDTLSDNPFTGFQDAQRAARPVNPWMRERIATHEDPLGQRARPEPPRQLTTRDGEAFQRAAAQARTPEQAFSDLSGDRSERPDRMIGTATHQQYEAANARRRAEARSDRP